MNVLDRIEKWSATVAAWIKATLLEVTLKTGIVMAILLGAIIMLSGCQSTPVKPECEGPMDRWACSMGYHKEDCACPDGSS